METRRRRKELLRQQFVSGNMAQQQYRQNILKDLQVCWSTALRATPVFSFIEISFWPLLVNFDPIFGASMILSH